MKRQTVLITHLCLLAVLMSTDCQGGPSTPTSTAGKEVNQQALESALATRFLNDPTGLCEWEVWGEARQDIYLWAICQSAEGAGCSAPAVVRVAQDESSVWRIREVEMPRDGTLYGEDVRVLFPSDVQRRILAHNYDTNAAWARIEARRDQVNRQAIRVTLGIFSGRPDPTWTLTPAQTIELRQRLAALPLTDQPFDDVEWFPSGYHGLTLLLPAAEGQPPQLVEVYKGIVRVETASQVTRLADEDHALERWLLTGGSGDDWSEFVGTILEELEIDRQGAVPHAPTPTPVFRAVPSNCAGFGRPALVLIPSPAQRTNPASFILTSPDGDVRCTLTPPNVSWSSDDCQVVGENVYCWSEIGHTLQALNARSGELAYVTPGLGLEEPRPSFLVSHDEKRIVWSVSQLNVSPTDVPEGTSHCRIHLTRADGSGQRVLLEKNYEDLYHLIPVAWTPAGDAFFFTRRWIVVESGGSFIPPFAGRYSNLYRLDIETSEVQKVFPLDDETSCSFCIGDITSDGRWLAYHREDASLYLRDLVSEEETLVADASFACYLGYARLSPDASHLVYVEMQGECDKRDTFDLARTVMVDVPFSGQSVALAGSTEAVDWPIGWLDGETPVFDRIYKGFRDRGLWVAGESSEPDDLLPGMLAGVLHGWREEK